MKIIVTTCDQYLHVLRGFVYMFNKYWSSNAEVMVLGYDAPSFDLPSNFKFISLGEQGKYGRDWTTALIPFFKQLLDEYFVLLTDDSYILNIDRSLLPMAEEQMAKGAEKVHLTNISGRVFHEKEKDANFNIWKQDANYRLSLQPHITRKDYLLKYLNPGKSIWQYEVSEDPMNDGAQILVPKQNIVFYSDFMNKGKVADPTQISRIKKEDLDMIRHLEVF